MRRMPSHSSEGTSSMLSRIIEWAALFTSTSSPPNSSSTRCTGDRQWRSSPTSPPMATALRPASSTRRTVSCASASSSRYETMTSAPSRANARATARPMPLSAPVITARLPSSRPDPL